MCASGNETGTHLRRLAGWRRRRFSPLAQTDHGIRGRTERMLRSAKNLNRGAGLNVRGQRGFIAVFEKPLAPEAPWFLFTRRFLCGAQ
ncbi:MAG TPA: hypothetical protein DEB39_07460 [Planctomycetaceae bacterium]|nr:hypothetical protein [Planctomycetaceae bacterium]